MSQPTRNEGESQADFELRLGAYRKSLVDAYEPGVSPIPDTSHPAVLRRIRKKVEEANELSP